MIKKSLHESFHIIEARVKDNTLMSREFTDFDEMNFNEKTLIVLCGNTTKNPMKALSYAGTALRWLRDMPDGDKVKVYSIFYPGDQPLFSNFSADPTFDYTRLSKKIFKKIATKNGKYLKSDQIVKNLDNVVFFGHSVGGMIMDNIVDQFEEALHLNEFSQYEIRKILSNIVFVGYAPFEVIQKPINAVYITPLYDSLGSSRLVLEKILRQDRLGFITNNPQIAFVSKMPSKFCTYNSYFDKYAQIFDGKDITYIANKRTLAAIPDLLYDDGLKEDHNLAGVIDYPTENPFKTKTGEETTKLMHTALRYCFNKKGLEFNGQELFKIINQGEPSESGNEPIIIEK